MIKSRTLKQWFSEALFAMSIRLPLAILVLIYFLLCLKDGVFVSPLAYFKVLKEYFSDRQTWIYWTFMWPVTLIALTFYPYARERNPKYIKKMEAYERKKQSLQTGVTEEEERS